MHQRQLIAKLLKLTDATAQADFGDPVDGTTVFQLCIYDDVQALAGMYGVDRAGAACGPKAKPCWRPISTKGYRYSDPDAATDGFFKLLGKSGAEGKGLSIVIGRNNEKKGQTALPTGLAAALEASASATMQLEASDGRCFSSGLDDVKKSTSVFFKGLGAAER